MSETGAPDIGRYAATTLIGAVAIFTAWCGADYWLIVNPEYNFPHRPFLFCLVIGQFGFAIFRHPSLASALSSTRAAFLLAVALILVIGLQIHFALGGGL